MAKKTGMTTFQRVFVIISGLFFLFSMSSVVLSMLAGGGRQNQPQVEAPETIINEQLEKQALGYEKVLEKEPNNKYALDGLINTRLEMNDIQGLEKQIASLKELHPEETVFEEVMSEINDQLKTNSENLTPETSP